VITILVRCGVVTSGGMVTRSRRKRKRGSVKSYSVFGMRTGGCDGRKKGTNFIWWFAHVCVCHFWAFRRAGKAKMK